MMAGAMMPKSRAISCVSPPSREDLVHGAATILKNAVKPQRVQS